jgi:hypothetical protein
LANILHQIVDPLSKSAAGANQRKISGTYLSPLQSALPHTRNLISNYERYSPSLQFGVAAVGDNIVDIPATAQQTMTGRMTVTH